MENAEISEKVKNVFVIMIALSQVCDFVKKCAEPIKSYISVHIHKMQCFQEWIYIYI